MNSKSNIQLSGLARRLVKDNLLDEETALEIDRQATANKNLFVPQLVASGKVDARVIAEKASDEFGVPLLDLNAFNVESLPTGLVDTKLISKHHALPLFHRGNRLFIAVSDPTNQTALDEIKFHTGIKTDLVLVDEVALSAAIHESVESAESLEGGNFDGFEDGDLDLELDTSDDDQGEPSDEGNIDETPIVRFINKVLVDAIRDGASDIHFEPYEKSYRVRFRTDGILREVVRPPQNLAPRMAARLKVMSQMDISERRMPQDGRIKMKLSKNRAIDFRVNTLPCLFGEKIVLRILDPSSAQMGIDMLGYEPEQKDMFMEALKQPQGMILVTGPTGSGKTVSLYTGLNILNTPDVNISTAEDPVEINLDGINQCHVNPKFGLTFAEALRSFLRQDPDIIMVGEIRDLETAEISIKAAQTGHMVMSTLHTNSAAETITRLLNMGIPSFNIATSVSLIIAQRLARRLCKECKTPADIPREALLEMGFSEDELKDMTLFSAVGCSKCTEGYKGRVGIYEVVKITPELARIIMEEGNSIEIGRQARKEGFNDLRKSALRKAASGDTSLEEVNRVTQD